MIFGLADALALFVFAAILVGVGSYVLMRQKMDWRAWAWLSLASMPPAAYFAVRNGGGVLTSIEVMLAVAAAWAFYFASEWIRERIYTWSSLDDDASTTAPAAPAEPAEVFTPSELSRRSLAYVLLGFGISLCAAGAFAFQMLFLPRRGSPALLPIDAHSPALMVCSMILAVGLLLAAPGWWLLKHGRGGAVAPHPGAAESDPSDMI